MKYLITPKQSDAWVAVPDGYDAAVLQAEFRSIDACLSDIDGTIAPSFGVKVAYSNVVNLREQYRKFAAWGIKAGYKIVRRKHNARKRIWQEYIDMFMRKPEIIKKIDDYLTPEVIRDHLFGGIEQLYEMFPDNMATAYITQNIATIAHACTEALDFDTFFAESFDKEVSTSEFIEAHPHCRNYFVMGNNVHDEEILDALDFYYEKGRIDSVLSCFKAGKPGKINERFTINVGKDYTGLVDIFEQTAPVR